MTDAFWETAAEHANPDWAFCVVCDAPPITVTIDGLADPRIRAGDHSYRMLTAYCHGARYFASVHINTLRSTSARRPLVFWSDNGDGIGDTPAKLRELAATLPTDVYPRGSIERRDALAVLVQWSREDEGKR